jgi:O-antigen/teichoic acid export membrane protein
VPTNSRADEPGLGRAHRWAGQGLWAITDQGLVSLSNFLLNVLLARWLAADQYGAFTVSFSILLFVGTFHGALLTDPMLVFGTNRFASTTAPYLRVLVFGHWSLTSILALLMLGGGAVIHRLGSEGLSAALLGLAVGTPLYLMLVLLRRACYLKMKPKQSAVASGVYFSVTLLAVLALAHATEISPGSGFLALSAGSIVASAWLFSRLEIGWALPSIGAVSEVLQLHWRFSRWTLGANVAHWVRGNLYFFTLPLWGGLEASGAFRAMANLIMPMTQPLLAISPLLLVAFTKQRSGLDFGATVRRVCGLLIASAVVYWLLLSSFRESIFSWLYAGKYFSDAKLVWAIGLIPICTAGSAAIGTALRALERPDRDFWATAVSATVTSTIGILLTGIWGLSGAVIGMTLSYVVATVLLAAMFISLLSQKPSYADRP